MILSIIVPVYNVEDYIQECISSILSIDIDDMEVIVIDDGSTDKSIEKVNQILDSRIKIVSQENKGLSGARNTGLDLAKGKYVYFIDSDDYINSPEVILDMIDLAEVNNLDCVMGNGYYYWNEETKRKIYDGKRKPRTTVIEDIDDYIIHSLKNNYYQDMVWLNIYNKHTLAKNNLKFSEGHYHEDIDWTTKFLLNASKIGYVDNPFYIYRQREGSITKDSNKLLQLSKDKIYMAKEIYKLLSKLENLELKDILYGRASELYFAGAISGRREDKNFFKKIDILKLNDNLYNQKLRKWIKIFNYSPEFVYRVLSITNIGLKK